MSKRAQISMNTIVYVAIALLVLVLIVAFTTGGLGNVFGQITETGIDDIDTAKAQCSSICATAKTQVSSSGHTSWQTSQYCRKQFNIDIDGDGNGELYNCWDSPIFISCSTSVRLPIGTFVLDTLDEGDSSEGGECDSDVYQDWRLDIESRIDATL